MLSRKMDHYPITRPTPGMASEKQAQVLINPSHLLNMYSGRINHHLEPKPHLHSLPLPKSNLRI